KAVPSRGDTSVFIVGQKSFPSAKHEQGLRPEVTSFLIIISPPAEFGLAGLGEAEAVRPPSGEAVSIPIHSMAVVSGRLAACRSWGS
ncbi:hypothetical protein MYX78_13875, partial [Acidobacteria bacterium AH-259-G07]|nr:hypothetical protein [Acidobacteria bacterium AH-259-G07]